VKIVKINKKIINKIIRLLGY